MAMLCPIVKKDYNFYNHHAQAKPTVSHKSAGKLQTSTSSLGDSSAFLTISRSFDKEKIHDCDVISSSMPTSGSMLADVSNTSDALYGSSPSGILTNKSSQDGSPSSSPPKERHVTFNPTVLARVLTEGRIVTVRPHTAPGSPARIGPCNRPPPSALKASNRKPETGSIADLEASRQHGRRSQSMSSLEALRLAALLAKRKSEAQKRPSVLRSGSEDREIHGTGRRVLQALVRRINGLKKTHE